MAQLIVRNLDEQLKKKLQMQASLKGISMEEEVRQILSKSVKKKNYQTGQLLAEHFRHSDFEGELERMPPIGMRAPDLP